MIIITLSISLTKSHFPVPQLLPFYYTHIEELFYLLTSFNFLLNLPKFLWLHFH